MRDHLQVKIDGRLVGRLWLDKHKNFCFQYNTSWLQYFRLPLSLSLPLQKDPFLDDLSHPFFANLLPEEKIKVVLARNLGISLHNDYGILERIGGDCAGAVSLDIKTAELKTTTGEYRQLSTEELATIIKELSKRPFLAGEEGIRLSLAGAQKKLPIYYDEHDFHLSIGSVPSNAIIKPPIEDFDSTVENETFCMALAKTIGLDVPESFIYRYGKEKVFVIKRYDRVQNGPTVKRLHQEDFCQALGVLPEYKYEVEGGPSLAACFSLVRNNSTRAAKDVLSLLNWVIFNVLIGNSDAHAKNISLLLLEAGPVLAPFYDLLSTRIYSHYGLTEKLAMKIGGESNPNLIQKKQWQAFADEVKIKPHLVLNRVVDIAKQIEANRLQLFERNFAQDRCDALFRLMQLMSEQCKQVIKRVS
ncbi:serine/threonine-protein kinase HipA [Desulfuromusa kysingii]|uniref:Serine/threonine-protein kinase HipA n=1 Tax=Desulfuromusa kysingii TaxID=37625 RepID=A0A1H4C666_9BACT|nr:type II toxin-antitoxin system HipA family toxin [Desulfuromusa kysingii]SEA55582.1 serine/threonine-protein kinase HipA [Desulfuromusa kysingii]